MSAHQRRVRDAENSNFDLYNFLESFQNIFDLRLVESEELVADTKGLQLVKEASVIYIYA